MMEADMEPFLNSPEELYDQFIDYQRRYLQLQQQQYHQKKQFIHQEDGDDDNHDDNENIIELAQDFEYLIDSHLKVLIDLRSRRSMSKDDESICKKLEVMLREERNTWSLAKALFKDLTKNDYPVTNGNGTTNGNNGNSFSRDSDIMTDDSYPQMNGSSNNNHYDDNQLMLAQQPDQMGLSEEQIIANYFDVNNEVRKMQLVTDWLEANEAMELDYKNEEDKVEFYSEGPTAWENTFHAMRTKYAIDIPNLDITINPNAGIELCNAMDPDAPIRTKKALAHADKEVEIRLFKHLFRFVRAGKLDEGQELAQRVGYYWLSAILDGWLPYSDPNLDQENFGLSAVHEHSEVRATTGNRRRDVWKQTCYKAAKLHGLTSCEKAILGVFGGNLKSVLPICNSWSDQLWARLKCSIEVKIEKALRKAIQSENRNIGDYPKEFYDSYQNFGDIFKSIHEQKIISPFKEATIHQTVQKYLILHDIDGLLNQLKDWSRTLDYDNNLAENGEATSPQFLRFFAHVVLFLRELNLVTIDDTRGTLIIESYIGLLTQHRSIESVAHYTMYLPKDNQISSYAKLLATIDDTEGRKRCLEIARDSNLDIDEITQSVVELIRDEPSPAVNLNTSITQSDRRKINALDYLLYLEAKNYVAILHHGNVLLRYFALQKKMEAVKETFNKLPIHLSVCVENQWRLHTNGDITISLKNNIRELECFKLLLEAQEELTQWYVLNHRKPEEPKKPANLSKFCHTVNYEQCLKQYQQDMNLWKDDREVRTNALSKKITELFHFPGGWMRDLPTTTEESTQTRLEELDKLRKIFIPQMTTVIFNVYHLTHRYEDCLKLSHLLVQEDLKLYNEYSKAQIRDFLDKISDVTKKLLIETLQSNTGC